MPVNLIYMDELIQYLHAVHPMGPDLEAHLRSKLRLHVFPRGSHLLRIGELSQTILFITKGLVRSYHIYRREEVSNWFMKEGDVCISILSFLRRWPSVDSIVALEDCECWGITYEELEETYRLYPTFNIHGRLIANEYYCRSEERQQAIRRQTPEDKYARLMEKDTALVRRVQNNHLASFLNVGDRTFNLIRKAFKERKGRK